MELMKHGSQPRQRETWEWMC